MKKHEPRPGWKTAFRRFCPVGGRTDVDIVLICPGKILTLDAHRV
jgi:hypothetical protein